MAEYICPHCKKPVYDDDALLCLYCGESLERPKHFLRPRIVLVFVVILLLVSFIAYFLR
ncbi:MAG TPA: zinc ribbon domain-containing protein [Candidatus Omnitrophota bacterium]|nr:hypothetical protein [Candidatus Omnitrophota bacterium]HNQ49820.1 zinc ribbon domain-containing protein [Candidatus Omnitrophota bacterium]HQO38380.1 zinc ribbon domain-containing protein [Candidatus Omnitrophota bacterium]HQQ05561.1 zinc ribbon domain-containing protein [Candidatus Omnitrophota bacterium]